MYRSKKDVDKLVENLLSKLSEKEFQARGYSVAHKYYEVGDYASCQKYVEEYLKHKDNNAAAFKLYGQALHKMGQKEKALEQFKMSLDFDPSQTTIILDICELLADDEVIVDPNRAKYWCEKAEAIFPRHPVTFKLRERLITASNSDPEALVALLMSELSVRPKDVLIHARLLDHYINTNNIKGAFDHACNVEFHDNSFINNYTWYNSLNKLLKNNAHNTMDWLYQLLLLTVRERICLLSITETPSGLSQSLIESNELLHAYDQAIDSVAKTGAASGYAEFHKALLQHHRGQFAFHAATLLLKKAKKDQLSWRDATTFASPLMLSAWQVVPLDPKVNWMKSAPVKQVFAVKRWYTEGSYRCSQAGHYLLSFIQDKNQSFLDQVSQCYSGTHWRDKFYKKMFPNKAHLDKMKSSYIASDAFYSPILRIPRKAEVEAYDLDAQKEYGNSLHHFVWMLLHYKNFSSFKCVLFDMLDYTAATCAPETLNKLDIYAFLYCTTLSAQQQKSKEASYVISDKPRVLPANITDLLCSLSQMKWWDCAYKFSQNELGTELTDIRATLSRGIEVIRCIDNHGLDPELLCILGRIFGEQAELTTSVDARSQLEARAGLYYQSAIPLLEKLKSKIVEKIFGKRMFCYIHKELGTKELNNLIEECKLYLAVTHFNNCEYERVIEMISNLKSPQAYYYIAQTYKKMALEESNLSRDIDNKSKLSILLTKAKAFAFKTLNKLKENDANKKGNLYTNSQELIEEIETLSNKIEPDLFVDTNDGDGKYSSEENLSAISEYLPNRTTQIFRNVSSTPKATKANTTNYRTAMDTQILDNTRMDQAQLATIENEIKKIQKRDSNISDFMDQTKSWFEENRKLSNEIISTIQTNMQNTTDQFKLLKISVDQVKGEIDECRNEYKDVGELKKDIVELRKEVNKLKNIAAEQQAIDDSELYNLDDEYRTNDNTSSSFAGRLPFSSAQVLPPFNQRLVPPFGVPPNTYQLYNQSLMNLYNQYSQFAQPPAVPSAQSIFDPTRSQVNFSGVFPTPEQIYLDGAHLVPPNVPTVPPIPAVPPVLAPSLPTVPAMPSGVPTPAKAKETSRHLPVNVVITSSDPLPTCTTTPAPALSVTIPPKHIKGTPHNYQIPMPSTNDVSVNSPPVFTIPQNKTPTSSGGTFSNWNQSSIFKTTSVNANSAVPPLLHQTLSARKMSTDTLDMSKTVVDGIINVSSPNTSLNKSRTISEKSNTSVENYDPCPDFKPIVPLPAEVKVTTGEEDEITIFSSRAKLFRFIDKQWKERGIGEIKLLKHKSNGKVRVLMRREQVHKICANHIITSDMEIKPMKNETKAYFWVANDFADEKVVLEKFCIRFKTANLALDFYKAFENARQSSMASKTDNLTASISDQLKIENPMFNFERSFAETQGKSVIGGFTFSSTPTLKPISDITEAEVKKPQEVVTNKVNVFSGLSFKTNTSSATSNVFNVNPTLSVSTSKVTENVAFNTSTPSNLNNSDTVEEFEPDVDFKPVIPLPALVDQKTGEEDETILFEHRAKLLRFDSTTKEWKERGLGNIKLLVHKDNIQKVRLLMRREQIMKVCCNHAITKDMTFQKMPNMDKAVTWCAKDFSEGELVAETFCLRFKTVLLCDQFIDAIKAAQTKMTDKLKLVREEQIAGKQTKQTGFGDMFKPKSGSWHCDTCYTNNLESFERCACCETPKPEPAPGLKNTDRAVTCMPSKMTVTVGWGDKFKPKPGSWECKACLVRNEGSFESCSACNSPKDPTKVKSTEVKKQDSAIKFNFGIPPTTGTSTVAVKNESVIVSTGQDLFKPNPVSNNNSIFSSAAAAGRVQFQFGMPSTTSEQESKKEASIFDGTGAPKFNFGVPSTKFGATDSHSPLLEKPNNIFFVQKVDLDSVLDYTVKKMNDQIVKPALLPTPKTDSSTSFVINEDNKFNYVFKPKTDISPMKSPLKDGENDDENYGNEYADEDECQHTFTPVIPLPDKVEVITGEENETVLYGHVAKLYRFTSSEWKERGKGIVTILKHKDTGKLRVVMRREQILKICLNHSLSAAVTYNQKDEKSWMFTVNDFSDGELTLEHFCLRFKNKEIALEFKEAVDKALQDLTVEAPKIEENPIKLARDETDDVIFVNEIQSTKEEKEKASELMLPENFFNYKNKEPCQGCRGCHEDEYSKKATFETPSSTAESSAVSEVRPIKLKAPFISTTNASTPVKGNTPLFQSPTNSIYGTPTTADKTVDTSIFRTPLGSIGSNSKTPTVPSTTQNIFGNNMTNKENTFLQKPSILSGVKEENTDKDSSQSVLSVFGNSNASVSAKSSVIAPPKFNLSKENQNETGLNHFSFGSSQSKPAFSEKTSLASGNIGVSSNKSIFDNNVHGQNTEVKSIFGDDSKSENLFMNVNQGSIFGPGVLANNETKFGGNIFGSAGAGGISVFGSQSSKEKPFETAKSLFSSAIAESKFSTDSKFEGDTGNSNISSDIKSKEENPEKADNIFSVYAAALSSNTGASFDQTKKNPNFKWQGAGEQLFVAKKTTTRDVDKSNNETGGGDEDVAGADEDYDPQYEPIVPLPDKIVVTTGEEDEQKLFGERCKLYRYDEKCREWKERGIGEMKILYHPEKKTYRLLLRREQVHKAVLNMLLHMDLELLQMKNSDRAWTWAGHNFAENPAGEQETLAVRFKSVELALSFQKEVIECVRKLQADAANALREQKETNKVTPLRLPKHLQESARADNVMTNEVKEQISLTIAPTTETTTSAKTESSADTEVYNEDHFTEVECEVQEDQDYEDEEDYNAYYQEEDEECVYHSCDGEAVIRQQDEERTCSLAHIQVVFDQDICSPKILITDSATGEILVDMVIYTDTLFEVCF
ncbi:unnamed protein product [Arctia plantaginis]|uniref:E3 SUMO-protein ligase RanBP2 n=1 Tax=Arctia plantaginis TaxID=874455 RepID=A0A8S0ZS63_ARCPL|nr:unnamed protein product [Arctia plantaginis]